MLEEADRGVYYSVGEGENELLATRSWELGNGCVSCILLILYLCEFICNNQKWCNVPDWEILAMIFRIRDLKERTKWKTNDLTKLLTIWISNQTPVI